MRTTLNAQFVETEKKKEIQKRNKTDSYQRLYYCVLDIAISQQQYSLINKAQLY